MNAFLHAVIKSFKRSPVQRHVTFWVLFIAYEVLYITTTVGIRSTLTDYMVYYMINIALFYFNAYVILDYAFFKTSRPWLNSAMLILFELAGYLLIKFVFDFFMAQGKTNFQEQLSYSLTFVVKNLWRGIYFIGLSSGYFAMLYFLIFQEKAHRAEREHTSAVQKQMELEYRLLAAENAYLQSQLSPHLLFNTLNFIYKETYKISDRAGQGILILSDLLRYSLDLRHKASEVTLAEEVHQVEQLLRINRLRFHDALQIRLEWDGQRQDKKILPMLLVTFVENMIKHGDLRNPESPGIIAVETNDTEVIFKTKNCKNSHESCSTLGTGLANARKRADNAYHGRYKLEIEETDEDYTLTFRLHYETDLLHY